jgi:methylenetetrahydrofolate--tRNA-(uracil-5-)-methyltransferase
MNQNTYPEIIIVGGGLAGSEAAWQAAARGVKVHLFEMRPKKQTGAHNSGLLAELVCSNSLGSNLPDRASGILKNELRTLGSLLINCADQAAVPAGGALAVDRDLFSQLVTSKIENNPLIEIMHQEVTRIPEGTSIIATGPLTSPSLSKEIQKFTGYEQIFFYDALAPIIYKDTINFDTVFQGTRYGNNGGVNAGDYLNCPMNRDEYYRFVDELINAEQVKLQSYEKKISLGVRAGVDKYFEGCLPIEIIAKRGIDSLAYGPLRPVGLTDSRTGQKSFAVVQLRQDNLAQTLYNMVGFQTNLKQSEQIRVFKLIPGLEMVEFARFGQMHRNTFILSPALLYPTLQCKFRDNLFFSGQITGIEGYVGNIAAGYLAGVNAARFVMGQPLLELPPSTMIGALCRYITQSDPNDFQPMKANLGILPDIDGVIKGKRMRAAEYAHRASADLNKYLSEKYL